jgi:hypothetical protein
MSRDYEIGYGKPPKKHQFKPGQSGNRRGRPKGTKNTATLLREILDRKIELRIGPSVRKITVREGILTRITDRALKGDTKSADFVLRGYDGAAASSEQATSTTLAGC